MESTQMFNELTTVENYIRDLLSGRQSSGQIRELPTAYSAANTAFTAAGLGWEYIPSGSLPRAETDVLVEKHLRDALIRLNPEIAAQPSRADEVIYHLRAILLGVHSDGLVKANEQFTAWLRGEKTMPFGPSHQHVPVRMIDYDTLPNNRYVVSTQVTYRAPEKRFDLVLFVNGIPLIVGEAKTPVRASVSWVDGAHDIHHDYELSVPAFFVPNVFSFATEGKTYRFGSIGMSLDLWAPWIAPDNDGTLSGLQEVESSVRAMLKPDVLLDILQNFSVFATDKRHRKIKIICRYQQYYTANQIVARVIDGLIKKGLIWHFQGSGKSLLMVFAAQKLRLHPALKNPTILIVVDRLDLDTQITATFNATDVPNTVAAETREELQRLLAQDARKVIITTIHKFAEAPGVLNTRSNIILMADEAHRTQEGDLGHKMRQALPNAFLFGLTGTPINKRDRNTFYAFGAEEDEHGYMSRYSFEESIRDGATLPLHFEARLVEMHIDRQAIDEAFANLTESLTETDQAVLSGRAARIAVLLKSPERISAIAADIARHYREKVEPSGLKTMIVAFDRESCVLYKNALDAILPPEKSAVVMTVSPSERDWRKYDRSKDEEEKLLDRFRDPADPLQFLIVTSKLLAGFDAPILQAIYLDKLIKEHNLLQAICRANRPYKDKTHGLIVDYLGIFDDVALALSFDDKSVQRVVSNIEELKSQVHGAVRKCLSYFIGVDRSIPGYEGLLAAQECLPDNETRDAFASDYSVLSRLWETLSPSDVLTPYTDDYRWLSQVYESVKPPSGHGKLLWHVLGAKTIELIHENVHVNTIHDDLETLVMDADVLSNLLDGKDPSKAKEVEIKIIARLSRHRDDPKFIALGLRLEDLKDRLEQGLLTNINFLKSLLELARDVVQAEKQVDPVVEQDKGVAALTELFTEVRTQDVPIIVERIVADIDNIVKIVRFPGWQQTVAGEREVKQALRKTLLKYKLAHEQDLFDRAYAYIEQYY
jgi:type I restriction enzyme R subunit